MKGMNKRAQLTLFIILAIAIVIVLVLLFVGRGNLVAIFTPSTPVNQIKECVQGPVQEAEAIDILSLQGGSLEPSFYYLYEGNKLDYLCYTEEAYKTCVMQKPLLKQSIEQQIEAYASPRIKNCISSVKANLERKGYQVSVSSPEIEVSLVPENILVEIKSDIRIAKDKTESYKYIKTDMSSSLYEHVMIASSISNWEARYGESEQILYMNYYPDLRVDKKRKGDGTTVYILSNRDTEETFMFAIRSVVIAPGITGS